MPARRKRNPGQEQLQREWYGPHYRPPTPNRLHVAGDLVGKVLKDFGLRDSSTLSDIEKCWANLAGKANAEHSRPGKIERGVLTVYVNHHVWLNEMKQVASKSLLKKLQERFGKSKVRLLRFEMAPDDEM
jgi:predicted nucleic acid-binding Zn ribbon protein